jgi:ribosomal protein S18 acetylase RimI-like enzyme
MAGIQPVAKYHSEKIAQLHLRFLPTFFKGTPGRHLLKVYYEAVACGHGATCFVAEEGDRIQGYICSVWDSGALQRELIRKSWHSLVYWGIAQAVINPSSSIAWIRNSLQPKDHKTIGGYELRPIVVDVNSRGTGLAIQLVERLVQDAIFRGYQWIYLYTEMENIAAQKFYCKVGFHEVGVVHRSGKPYLFYKRRVAVPHGR